MSVIESFSNSVTWSSEYLLTTLVPTIVLYYYLLLGLKTKRLSVCICLEKQEEKKSSNSTNSTKPSQNWTKVFLKLDYI